MEVRRATARTKDPALRLSMLKSALFATSAFPNRLKKFQKSRKKACQPLAFSARRGIRATNSTVWPFKKKFKKVKKKLVRPLEI
jgi:hypothetical protein